MLEIYNIKAKQEYLKEIAELTQKEWGNQTDSIEEFNEKRNEYFIEKTFKDLIDKKIINIQHYGMPTEHSICIGCHWKEGMYALLTAPGEDIYFINPLKSDNNRFKHDNFNFTLSPHGLGQKVPNKNADIKISKDNIRRLLGSWLICPSLKRRYQFK